MFSIYTAGSQDIVLDYDQAVFLIWFANLDEAVEIPYPPRTGPPKSITADDIMKIQGEVASSAELKKQIEDVKSEMKEKFHTSEQSRLYNRYLIKLLIGLVLTVIGWVFLKPMFDRNSQPKGVPPTAIQPASLPAKADPVPNKEQEK